MCLLFFFYFTKRRYFKNYKNGFSFPLKSSFCPWNIQCSVIYLLFFPVSRFKGPDQKWIFVNMFYNSKGLVTSFRPFFMVLSIEGTGCKEKNQVTFSMVFFTTTYFQKSLACTDWFWLFTKIKNGYGTSFYCRLSAYLFHKHLPC